METLINTTNILRLDETRFTNEDKINETKLNETKLNETKLNETKLNETKLNETKLNEIMLMNTGFVDLIAKPDTSNTIDPNEEKAGAYGYNNKDADLQITKIFNENHLMNTNSLIPPMKKRVFSTNKLKLVTLNTWTMEQIGFSNWQGRIKWIVKSLIDEDADVIFLQEVGETMLEQIKNSELGKKYFISISKPEIFLAVNVITLVLSKKFIQNERFICFKGDHCYSANIVELDQYIFVNFYLHAGCYLSPGVTNLNKFSKLREQQIKKITQNLKEMNPGKKSVLFGGDFNCDLSAEATSWPELNYIKKQFEKLDINYELPETIYTEDTMTNTMRYAFKQIHKQVFYDYIFASNELSLTEIKLFGTKPVFKEPLENLFVRNPVREIIRKGGLKEEKFPYTIEDGIKYFNWFLSDHYGVVVTYELN
jgi:endonuclease/exonuclease/phosphatase family metal-dependent hydrolase